MNNSPCRRSIVECIVTVKLESFSSVLESSRSCARVYTYCCESRCHGHLNDFNRGRRELYYDIDVVVKNVTGFIYEVS